MVVANQGFLLGARPALELGFAPPGCSKRGKELLVEQRHGRVEPRRSTALAGGMVREPLCEMLRAANVECAGGKAEEIHGGGHARRKTKPATESKSAKPPIPGPFDAGCALAQGHLPRQGPMRFFGLSECAGRRP